MTAIYKVTYKDKDGEVHKDFPVNAANPISACSRIHKMEEGNVILGCFKGQKSGSPYVDGMIHYPEVANIFKTPYRPIKTPSRAPSVDEFGFVEDVEQQCKKNKA